MDQKSNTNSVVCKSKTGGSSSKNPHMEIMRELKLLRLKILWSGQGHISLILGRKSLILVQRFWEN